MKKKILLISLLVVMFVCAFAISVSAYTPATSYNYYEDSVADENLLYSVTTQMDPTRERFEMTVTESGDGFAKYDGQGNPISWYVDSYEVDANGNRNVVVKSALTIGGVGTVDANGLYTFGGGTVEGITSMDIVSANFFGTGVKTLPDEVFMSKATDTPHASEYTVFVGGTELLCLYLPKTLTAFPARMCARSAVRVIEFEDNQIAATKIEAVEAIASGGSPFAFCGNLKAITIPEGIETIAQHAFRENCSLKYVKLPSTMTRLEQQVFRRCNAIETVILGSNMTYAAELSTDYLTMQKQGVGMKYIWVPNTINTAGSRFDSYRGVANQYLGIDKSIVFFYIGTLEEALVLANSGYTDRHFSSAAKGLTSAKNSSTKGEAPVTYAEYLANKNYYDNLKTDRHLLVYNVPKCAATYEPHSYVTSVTAPTCMAAGSTKYTCTVCQDTYSVEIPIDKDAHVYDGADDIDCNNCGFIKDFVCVDHNYAENVTAPDCTNGGYTTYTCTICGDTYKDNYVDALGHTDGEAVIENNVAPDCVNGGSYETVVYCEVCKAELSRTKTTTDALGHSYGSVVTEPDCENDGYTTYTCSVCGDTYDDNYVDALGHTNVYTNTYKDTLTSFEVGEVCSVCGAKGEITEYAPLLTYKGYSAQIDGDRVTVGYSVNKETQAFLTDITYGVLIAVPGESDNLDAYEPVNPDFSVNAEKAVLREVSKKYDSFNLFVDGFDESNYDKSVVICAFVTDGTSVDYLCANESNEISQQEYAAAVTFAEIAEACNPKYEITFTCDETMGTVEGELSQTVREGEKTTTVTATAKDGYVFACWSDGTQTPEITVKAKKNANLTACFVPVSTGLPVMTINTENGKNDTITLEDYINCEITLFDNTGKGNSVGSAVAEIKGRGNSTWKFDKKPYKFKFDKKQDLFGYGSEKTWVLLADARDYSLLRNMLALNAGLTMSELGYVSKGQSVELYLNDEYRGVYYLCEQIQVKENRVNIATEDDGVDLDGDGIIDPDSIGYLLEMDAWAADSSNQNLPNYTKDGDVFVTFSKGCQYPYVIKDPEDLFFDEDGNFDAEKSAPYLEYVANYLQKCRDAFNLSKTPENYEKVCELVDVKSFAQAYIIYDLFKHADTNYSSVYFYKDAYGKLVAAPLWDFDMAIGNVTHKSGAGTNAEDFRNTETLWTAKNNWFYDQLCDFPEFQALVYEELVANEAAIKASIAADLAYAREHKDAYERNFEKWDLIGNASAPEAWGNWSVPAEFKEFETWEDHLVYIENYLNESYAHLLDAYKPATAE